MAKLEGNQVAQEAERIFAGQSSCAERASGRQPQGAISVVPPAHVERKSQSPEGQTHENGAIRQPHEGETRLGESANTTVPIQVARFPITVR